MSLDRELTEEEIEAIVAGVHELERERVVPHGYYGPGPMGMVMLSGNARLRAAATVHDLLYLFGKPELKARYDAFYARHITCGMCRAFNALVMSGAAGRFARRLELRPATDRPTSQGFANGLDWNDQYVSFIPRVGVSWLADHIIGLYPMSQRAGLIAARLQEHV